MGTIDFVASAPQHVDHLAPVYAALDLNVRGVFYVRRSVPPADAADEAQADADDDLMETVARAAAERLDPRVLEPRDRLDNDGGLLVLASPGDVDLTPGHGQRLALMEPGSGQRYAGEDPHPDSAVIGLVLTVNPDHATSQAAAFSGARVVGAGSPKLDRLLALPPKPADDPPTIAIAFRTGDPTDPPERRGALEHFRPALARLAGLGMSVLGHGHPAAARWQPLAAEFSAVGIEPVRRFDDVVRRADIYIADNTSTLFEFAALDRPVIVLNAPWYRREVDHGQRFWEYADVGIQVDDVPSLLRAIPTALDGRERARRQAVVRALYANPGTATARAADALATFLADAPPGVGGSSSRAPTAAAAAWRPRRLPNVDILPADDGYIVHQPSADKVHHLNPSAAVILELSTGEHSVDDITALVRDLWELDRAPASEVARLLAELVREGLLEPPPTA